jgi:hypothetical protein
MSIEWRAVQSAQLPLRRHALTGPNRRMQTARWLRTIFVVVGGVRRICDALAIGGWIALRIQPGPGAIDFRRWPHAGDAIGNLGE